MKDLARIVGRDRQVAQSVVRAIESLAGTPVPSNLDVKALEGRPPWRRLRVGDWRAIYRPLGGHELTELSRLRGEPVEPGTIYVERIINRRDLEKVIAALR